MQNAKPALASRTLWVNMLVLAAGVAGFIAGHDVIVDYPAVVSVFVAVQGAANIVLRLVTSKPIK